MIVRRVTQILWIYLDDTYKPLWEENCKNKLESQECKEFCENVSEDTDPEGVCSSDARIQRATRKTVEAGASTIGLIGGAIGPIY